MESSNSSLCFSISSSSSGSLNLHSPPSKKHGHGYENMRFFFVDDSDEAEHSFLDSCFLCKKPISSDCEVFMYRGHEAFCSDDCRMDQMEMDESLETIERRQLIMSDSSSASITKNCSVKNIFEEKLNNNGVFSLKRRPTIANLNSGSPLSAR